MDFGDFIEAISLFDLITKILEFPHFANGGAARAERIVILLSHTEAKYKSAVLYARFVHKCPPPAYKTTNLCF